MLLKREPPTPSSLLVNWLVTNQAIVKKTNLRKIIAPRRQARKGLSHPRLFKIISGRSLRRCSGHALHEMHLFQFSRRRKNSEMFGHFVAGITAKPVNSVKTVAG
jgi:hypothetical protein